MEDGYRVRVVNGRKKSSLILTRWEKQKNSSYELRDKTGRCFLRVFCVSSEKNNKKMSKK